MKKVLLAGMYALAAILMMTSCLGESSYEDKLYDVPGIVRTHNGKIVVDTSFGTVYAPAWIASGFYDRDAVLVSFINNSDEPQNSQSNIEANGYITVQGLNIVSVPSWNAGITTDLTQAMDDEVALKRAIASTSPYLLSYIGGHLFVTSSLDMMTKQENSWYITLDPDQEPIADEQSNIYVAYLRSRISKEGEKPELQNSYSINAYYLKNLIDQIERKERTKARESYKLRFQYVSKINEEGEAPTWATETDPLTFMVSTTN